MIELTAAQVAQATGGRLCADPATPVRGPVVVDSRLVEPGSLFVALPGERVDGHDFAARAVLAGAVLVLCARPVPEPCVVVADVCRALGDLARYVLARLRAAGDLRVVAVTGSVGKTTTKDLLGQVLAPMGNVITPRGSFNNEVGLPLTVLSATPETTVLILEMGASGVGHLTYLTQIAPPDVAVVLAVGAAHLGEFGGIEAVAAAKEEIVTGLVPGGVAVLNADDPRVVAMATRAPGAVLTFGRSPEACVQARAVHVDSGGCAAFTVHQAGSEPVEIALTLVGEHQVSNALAAATVALHLGMTAAHVAAGLSRAHAVSPHRMQVTERADGITVIDDSYNANPDSMRAALHAVAHLGGPERRTVAVLGAMLELGAQSCDAHREIGRVAAALGVGLLVVVGNEASAIIEGAKCEPAWGGSARFAVDVEEAARILHDELRSRDVVLVKASNGSGLWRLGDQLVRSGGNP